MAAPRHGRYSRDEIAEILRDFQASGLSQRAFAEERGISKNTLAFWITRQRREAQQSRALVPIKPPSTLSTPGFELELDGIVLRVPRDVTIDEWRAIREAWIS